MKAEVRKKHIFVVGGSGGLGSKICEFFIKNGWICSILTKNNNKSGDFCLNLQADLKDWGQVQRVINKLQKQGVALDAVVFAGGLVQDQLIMKMSENQWDEVASVNLKSVAILMQGLWPLLKRSGGGHFVSVGSIVGVIGRAGQANYAAAKAGLIALSKSAAQEWGPDNIRSHVILPGFLKTNMTASFSAEQIQKIEEQNVLGRIGTLEEVARFVFFLCSTEHISGQVFNLDSRILPG